MDTASIAEIKVDKCHGLVLNGKRKLDETENDNNSTHGNASFYINNKNTKNTTNFYNALLGTSTLPGLLKPGNVPFPHQRAFVKRVLPDAVNRMLMLHDPGTGKTFTFLLTVAAYFIIKNRKQIKILVSVPASCMMQWKNAVIESLKISENRIIVTNQLCKLTTNDIQRGIFIIVTKETVGRAWNQCYEWVQAHHCNESGNWISQWDRRPNTDLHPLLKTNFDFFCIDEL
jgi:hypothetical protein